MLALPNITGCIMLMALAPLVPLATGSMEGKTKVILNEASITPEIKNILKNSTKLTVLTNNPASLSAAEYLELHGNYKISLEEWGKLVSPSQRLKLMKKQCNTTDTPDLVFSFSEVEAEMNAGGMMMLTGRIKTKSIQTSYILNCKDENLHKFLVSISVNQGTLNQDQTLKLNKIIGSKYARILMKLGGKKLPPLPKPKKPKTDN